MNSTGTQNNSLAKYLVPGTCQLKKVITSPFTPPDSPVSANPLRTHSPRKVEIPFTDCATGWNVVYGTMLRQWEEEQVGTPSLAESL